VFLGSTGECPLGTVDISLTTGPLGQGLDFPQEIVLPGGARAKGAMLKAQAIEIRARGQTAAPAVGKGEPTQGNVLCVGASTRHVLQFNISIPNLQVSGTTIRRL